MKARGPLNALSVRLACDGVLIRVNDGFGCIHPWPELGDPSVEKCLADLSGARRWPLVRRALRCAEYDGVARRFEHSLFEETPIPDSHATVTNANDAAIAAAVAAGFSHVKLKVGRHPAAEAVFLNTQCARFPELRWRLDFNERLEPAELMRFIDSLAPATRQALDFIEDPCPYADSSWDRLHRDTGIRLAVDREAAPLSAAAQVMIIKPALDEPFLLAEAAIRHAQAIVVTSYLDHPVGQSFAAWEAGRLSLQFPGAIGLCGLQTHPLFEPDAFSERLGPWAPAFQAPDGHGLGFDDLLDALPWTRLS